MGTTITSAYLTSAFWGTFTVGRLLGVWISTHLRSGSILTIDLLGSLASLSLIAIWPASTAALWIGAIGTGLFMASVFPTMLMLAGERLEISSGLTSWFLVGGGAGGMLLPWVIGQAFAGIGSRSMPVLVLSAIVLNLIAVIAFTSKAINPAG
jgi:FHS family Na+ dependent glucose MFS transporter 1